VAVNAPIGVPSFPPRSACVGIGLAGALLLDLELLGDHLFHQRLFAVNPLQIGSCGVVKVVQKRSVGGTGWTHHQITHVIGIVVQHCDFSLC
jgi:hypothetical protein